MNDESFGARRSYFMGPGGKITADPKTARGKKTQDAGPGDDPVQVNVKLDRETFDRLDEICQASERNLAQTVRRAVKLYLANLPEVDARDLKRWREESS